MFLDRRRDVKLGDFGLARVLHNTNDFAKTHVGTPLYMAPEQVLEDKYNEQSDVWALGCLVYEMAALHPPFRASNQLALAVRIRQGKYPSLPSHYSSDLRKAVKLMLRVQQAQRPTVNELLRLPCVHRALQQHKLAERKTLLKKREKEVRRREKELEQRALELADRERRLAEWEENLSQKALALGLGSTPATQHASSEALKDLTNTVSSRVSALNSKV